jgi:hypothetical protein
VTGFNHYSDCTCGWCVNYGRMSRATRVRLLDDLRHRDAVSLLKRNLARSISGCYVNPNAKCPVCDAAVYFYANEHGSRVFFDDLGPPWPKHPCTDNPREPVPRRGAPTRRTRGMMQELITAANTAGLFKNKVFGRRIPTEWTPICVSYSFWAQRPLFVIPKTSPNWRHGSTHCSKDGQRASSQSRLQTNWRGSPGP